MELRCFQFQLRQHDLELRQLGYRLQLLKYQSPHQLPLELESHFRKRAVTASFSTNYWQ
jgi:hypothetical protein